MGDYMSYWIVKLISKVLCLVPKFFRNAFATFLGKFLYLFLPKWREFIMLENIKNCLKVSDTRANEIGKESTLRFGKMAVEVMRFPTLNAGNIDDLVKVDAESEENLKKAHSQGKGIIIATAHYGNWELLGAYMGLKGYNMVSIARKQNNGQMDRFINEYREMVGQKVVYNHGENSMFQVTRALRKKLALGVLYDQDTAENGEELTLFGRKAVFPTGIAVLSRALKTPIVPSFVHNNPDGTVQIKFLEPFVTKKTKNKAADLRNTLEKLVIILEQEIAEDPAMWFWLHDRFKDGRAKYKQMLANKSLGKKK